VEYKQNEHELSTQTYKCENSNEIQLLSKLFDFFSRKTYKEKNGHFGGAHDRLHSPLSLRLISSNSEKI
jgi:hypothetical protein